MWRRMGAITLVVAMVWVVPVIGSTAPGQQPTTSLRTFELPSQASGRAQSVAGASWVELDPMPAGDTVMVGVDWHGVDGAAVQVRALADGQWSEWFELEGESEHGPDPDSGEAARAGDSTASEPVWLGDSDKLQFRTLGTSKGVTVHAVDVSGGDGLGWVPNPTSRLAAAEAATAQPAIRSRASWGADESLTNFVPRYERDVRFSVIHHTAGKQPDVASGCRDADDVIRGVYSYHTQVRGWDDIAYNFVVDPCGGVWEGRAGGVTKPVIGAHASGWNGGSTGVVLLGNYEGQHRLTSEMVTATKELLAWKLDLHHVDPRTSSTELAGGGSTNRYRAGTLVDVPVISAHQITNGTSCPGASVMAALFDGTGSNAWPKTTTQMSVLGDGIPKAFGGLPQEYEQPQVGPRPTWSVTTTEPVDWWLTITDENGDVVRSTGGSGEDESERTWDMRDDNGDLVAPGTYTANWMARGASGWVTPITTELTVSPPIQRMSGSDRMKTALELSRWSFDSSEEVILASASAYADALVASPLAGSYHAPVLLVGPDGITDELAAEIKRLGAYRAMIVGGHGVVSPHVDTQLKRMGLDPVERFGGSNRFETAGLVADRIILREGSDEILLALGTHADPSRAFPDALSAGWFGATSEIPLLLIEGNYLPAATRRRLDSQRPDTVSIFGGLGAVSQRVEDTVAAITRGKVERIAGSDRYGTSVAAVEERLGRIADWLEDHNNDPHRVDRGIEVVLASGTNWPDALGAGAAAANRGAIFLLVSDTSIDWSAAIEKYLGDHAALVSRAVVAGGPTAVAPRVVSQVERLVLSDGPHRDAAVMWPAAPGPAPGPQPSQSASALISESEWWLTDGSESASASPSPSPSTSSSESEPEPASS